MQKLCSVPSAASKEDDDYDATTVAPQFLNQLPFQEVTPIFSQLKSMCICIEECNKKPSWLLLCRKICKIVKNGMVKYEIIENLSGLYVYL